MISESLRWLGRNTPNFRYVRAIPNRVLKPLHRALGLSGGVVDVLGFKMALDPRECVDGGLWFAPQLYDVSEINFLMHRFPNNGVLVDVGSNIGFWSLRFAHAFPKSRIYAIEANPSTYGVLCNNININEFENVHPVNVGASDAEGEMPLYCNTTGNRGGDSFAFSSNERPSVVVPVKSLLGILKNFALERIDVMKMDIEGFEEKVLAGFFLEAPVALWPKFICVEISHVPQAILLLKSNGYRVVLTARENCVLELG